MVLSTHEVKFAFEITGLCQFRKTWVLVSGHHITKIDHEASVQYWFWIICAWCKLTIRLLEPYLLLFISKPLITGSKELMSLLLIHLHQRWLMTSVTMSLTNTLTFLLLSHFISHVIHSFSLALHHSALLTFMLLLWIVTSRTHTLVEFRCSF